MSIGYRKILRDLWRSKGRTLLAVLSITIGVFAVGMVTGMNDFLPANMTRSYRESNPAHLILYLNGTVDDMVVHNLTHVTGVAATEGVIQFSARWRPDANTPWRDVTIYAVADYTHQQFDRLELLNGQWPEARTLVPEHTTPEYFNLPPSGSITLQINDREHTVAYAGAIRDLQVYPPSFGGNAAFFASRDLVERLYGTGNFDVIKAQIPNFSQASAGETLQAIKHQLSKSGMSIGYSSIHDPGRHFNHIFEPASGRTSWRFLSVSVEAATATEADALSTAFALMPRSAAAPIVRARGLTAHFVTPDGTRAVERA